MLFRQQVKTVTHIAELPNFVQDRIGMHGVRGFLRVQQPAAELPQVRGRRRISHVSLGKTGSTVFPRDMFTDLSAATPK
jgi:hypothetical protein